jgi:hypothetical protein
MRPGPVIAQAILGPGEVLIQVTALGTDVRPADVLELNVTVVGEGETAGAAATDGAARRKAMIDGLVRLGVPRESITASLDEGEDGETLHLPPGLGAAVDAEGEASAYSVVTVVLTDMALAESVRNLMRGPSWLVENSSSRLRPETTDKANAAAVADGTAKARQLADAYAAGLGTKVVRIVGSGDRCGGFQKPEDLMLDPVVGGNVLRGSETYVTALRVCLDAVAAPGR